MAKRPQYRGGYGGPNMNQQASLMRQAQKMQEELVKAQEELENSTFTAKAGGGVVSATVSGKHSLISIEIDPEAVDPDDVEMLEDMIVAAANEAFHQMEEASSAVMAELTGGLGGLGGLSF